MPSEAALIPDVPVVDAQALLETFCYLACMGPDAFREDHIGRLVGASTRPDGQSLVEHLANPELREHASGEIGRRLATVLETRGRPATFDVGGMYPALVQVDVTLGFRSLVALAESATPELAVLLADPLLALALSEGRTVRDAGEPAPRFLYLLEILGSLGHRGGDATRLFLAMVQTLSDPRHRQEVLMSDLFPGTPEALGSVLLDGNDDALLAVIQGAATRPNGRTEFLDACRGRLDADLAGALPVMGRLDHLLRQSGSNGQESAYRPLVSALRAAVLVAIERDPGGPANRGNILSAVDDVPTLRLLSIVAPGIPEPMRSAMCEALLDGACDILRSGRVNDDNSSALVEVFVSATVLHQDPAQAGARIRQALVETAGILRVQLQARTPPDPACIAAARTFERIAADVAGEFRRRNALTSCLAGAMPLISDLSAVHDVPDAWPD